jgi:hypothetical protein
MNATVTSTIRDYRLLEANREADRSEAGNFEVQAANATFEGFWWQTQAARPSAVAPRSKAGVTTRVKKKLQGILVSFSGDEALVMFDNNGERIEYWLPADLLRKNGVVVSDQPFELIESEITDGPEYALQSKIIPLATASSGSIEPLALTKPIGQSGTFC